MAPKKFCSSRLCSISALVFLHRRLFNVLSFVRSTIYYTFILFLSFYRDVFWHAPFQSTSISCAIFCAAESAKSKNRKNEVTTFLFIVAISDLSYISTKPPFYHFHPPFNLIHQPISHFYISYPFLSVILHHLSFISATVIIFHQERFQYHCGRFVVLVKPFFPRLKPLSLEFHLVFNDTAGLVGLHSNPTILLVTSSIIVVVQELGHPYSTCLDI